MKGLFSGRQIKDLKGRSQRVTRSQTATGAYAAITLKYGSVEDSAKYFHTGKGNWNKYSLQNDKKRTGKLAASIEEWRERPHKLDFKGVDTKDGVSGKKPRFSVTSLKPSAKLAGRKGKSQVKATSKAILKNVVKPKPIKANHVYASFMRPLWIGFNPGVQYREIKVTDSHKDFRFNRKPHSVIVTSQPITQEKIKSLELTDLIKGKKLAKEVKRIKGLNFLDGNMKESLISQVLAGKDKAVIDKYIEKGRQLAEKKQKKQKFSASKLKQSGKLTGRKVKKTLEGKLKHSKILTNTKVKTNNSKSNIPKSKGHIMFVGDFEIYQKGSQGDIYASRTNNYIDVFGFRADARFIATREFWATNLKGRNTIIDGFKPYDKEAKAINNIRKDQAKVTNIKDKQKINAISKDTWIRHKNAEARSAGLNVDPAEVTKVLNNLVKNVKISRSGSTIKVESAYPEYAHRAVRVALESRYNDTLRLGVVKTISNKILYKGVTIVVSTNKGLKVKPLMGEFKNYKYKITPETGTIEYILNGGRLKGYEDKFNINLEAMEDLKIKAMKEIEDHIKSSNTYAHEPAKIMTSKPAKKPRKPRTAKPKKELSPEEQLKKQVREEASADWNNQAKMFMSARVPFRDKTARACYDRHAKAAGL